MQMDAKQNVNTGSITRRVIHTGGLGDGDKNCSLCAAAGVANLAQGNDRWTSSMVAGALGSADGRTGAGDSVDAQIATISEFGQSMTGRFPQVVGSMNHELDFNSAVAFMQQFPDGTVFAVDLDGGQASGDGRGVNHWLNAIMQNGQIEYVDYQASHAARMNQTARSNVPVVGVTGETVTNPNMIVIAFPPH